MATATFNVQIYPNKLTDGSVTFDVHLIDNSTGACVVMNAYCQSDALTLARSIAAEINNRTVNTAQCPPLTTIST
jgi:hypothetical protein